MTVLKYSHIGGRVERGDRSAETEEQQGQNGKALLTDYQHHPYGGERQKAGNFPQALQYADFLAAERCPLNNKIVQHDLPGCECDGVAYGQQVEKSLPLLQCCAQGCCFHRCSTELERGCPAG